MKQYMMMKNKIYIANPIFMELIGELATQITEMNYGEDTYGESSEVGQEGVLMFTEEANEYYDEMYYEYSGLFNSFNIYSDEK